MTRPPEPLADDLERAVQHLRLALVCLDAALEMRAAPYVQMAIDLLEDRGYDDLIVPDSE
jgi:hypothetical protein